MISAEIAYIMKLISVYSSSDRNMYLYFLQIFLKASSPILIMLVSLEFLMYSKIS